MLSEKVLIKLQNTEYWKRPYGEWEKDTWNLYFEKFSNGSERSSHRDLGNELDILIKNLNPKSKEEWKILALKREVSVLHILRNVKVLTSIPSILRPVSASTGKSIQSH